MAMKTYTIAENFFFLKENIFGVTRKSCRENGVTGHLRLGTTAVRAAKNVGRQLQINEQFVSLCCC